MHLFESVAKEILRIKLNMECMICCEDLFVKGIADYSTLCGHIFHEKCIRDWIKMESDPSKVCPTCRDPIAIETIHEIFVDVGDLSGNGQMLPAQISSLSDMMKRTEESTNFMRQSLETINLTLKSFETQNDALIKGLTPNSKEKTLDY